MADLGIEETPPEAGSVGGGLLAAAAAEEPEIERSRHFNVAYTRLRPRLAAIPMESAVRVTLDIGLVVQTVLGILPDLEQQRQAIAWELPRVEPSMIGELRETAFALAHLETLRRGAKGFGDEDEESDPLLRVRELRNVLLADVQPLVARGLLEREATTLSRGNSSRNVAFDTLQLVNYLDHNWDKIAGRTLTTREDLDGARDAVRDLLTYLGVRDQGGESEEQVLVDRQKSLTLLLKLYEELRWAVRYVRRHAGDADLIMPSLYRHRKRRGGGASEGDSTADGTRDDEFSAADSDEPDTARLEALMGGASAPKAASVTPLSPEGDAEA